MEVRLRQPVNDDDDDVIMTIIIMIIVQALMQMKHLLVDCSHHQAEHEDNVTKNRNPDVLPRKHLSLFLFF